MQRRLPAYPLFVKEPNFSLWSVTDDLNASNVQSWWGAEKKIYGFLKSGKKTYCFLGNAEDFKTCGVLSARQKHLDFSAFFTDYEFIAGKTRLKLRFVSPLAPNDLALLSMPVCYLEYEIDSPEETELSFFVNRNIAYNDINENVTKNIQGDSLKTDGYEIAFLGLKRQQPLSNSGDLIGADWGYWYLSGEQAYILDEMDLATYLMSGNMLFENRRAESYLGSVNKKKKGRILLGYDDLTSINYFGRFLKGYYLEDHTIFDAMRYVLLNGDKINAQLCAFDADLKKRAKKYGNEYLTVLYASLRQSIGAHKLVRDTEGNILFLSKECGSNGCIATVDVSYPSMPLYLIYNPQLVKGMMRPVLKFAEMPVWGYDFAPHDAGTYPWCCGQTYGLSREHSKYQSNLSDGEGVKTFFPFYILPKGYPAYDPAEQMPVEECANLLIMFFACYRMDEDISFFKENQFLCKKWVKYLEKYGLMPENQLCTDDFAGHLKNNINLAIKATVGIAAYAELAFGMGDIDQAKLYRKTAELFAEKIIEFGMKFKHLPLTWDSDDSTYSIKYNFVFDKIFNLRLFPQDFLEREVDFCLSYCKRYGIPLDNRAEYTKSDWICWAAALSDDTDKKIAMIKPLELYLEQTPDRVPFSDWYETQSGKYHNFRARSVQGGCFILLLNDTYKKSLRVE